MSIPQRVQRVDSPDEDEYGFFCDESGQNGLDGSALSLIVGNTFQGKGSFDEGEGRHNQHASARVTASTTDSIISLNACIEQRNSRPDAVATTLGMSRRHSSSLSTSMNSSISTPAPSPHCSQKSSMSSLAEGSESGDHELTDFDNLAEAPVWIVSEGACAHCDECRRRIVYTAHHTQPGRVFSRLFPVNRRGNSSSSSFPLHDNGSGLLSSSSSSSSVASSATTFSGIQRLNSDEFDRPTAAALGGFRVLSGRFGQQWAEFELASSSSSVASSATTFSGIQRLNSDEFDRPTAAALGGFRVLSGRFGQQWAEFELVVSSRTAVHRAWRTHADVGLLIDLVGVARKHQKMPNTNLAWEMLQRQRRWFNATEMLYLIDKRQILDMLFENLLYELDSPTQLLNFVDDATWSGSATGLDSKGGGRTSACTCEEGLGPSTREEQAPALEPFRAVG
eukprot:CAMPEP_0171992256 /NCGR_PEP_ID=MMETSP0993-20121228/277847_1 /TAXON_ID=483369 /ORGANISM="non described non described, Strain CCMP2098" /LENGTH=450 /DNA_ID=CAMNT_0012645299 /DNA_START=50 /DNA_END=1402 /DNA_ORIENTATION=-